MKKYSVLSIALLAVSAVTAAFIPSDAKSAKALQVEGTLKPDDFNTGQDTCTQGGVGDDCDYTVTEGVAVDENSLSATAAFTEATTSLNDPNDDPATTDDDVSSDANGGTTLL